MTTIKVNSDIEDTLHRAFHMSSVAVSLAEKALTETAESLTGLKHTYVLYPHDVDTLLWTLHEAHAQVREAFRMLAGDDDDAAAETVAEADHE